MTQLPLRPARPPIARKSDPRSSHEAAEEITASGLRDRQLDACRAACERWPGRTSAELAELAGLDRYVVARRLPELRAAGEVHNGSCKTCDVTGRAAMTWWAK